MGQPSKQTAAATPADFAHLRPAEGESVDEQAGDAEESGEVQGVKTSAAGSSIASAVWKTLVPARVSRLEAMIHGDEEFSESLERPADGAAGGEAAASASDRNTRTSAG